MSTQGAQPVGQTTGRGAHDHSNDTTKRTPAQWFALIVGLTLILIGLLGFLADATFDTGASGDNEGGNVGGGLQGDSFLGFEVNGWHNVVHILTGALLLSGAKLRKSAKAVTLVFGLAYLVVTLIGLIDGDDVLGLIPVNPADNVLHIVLSLGAIAASLISRGGPDDDRAHDAPRTVPGRDRR